MEKKITVTGHLIFKGLENNVDAMVVKLYDKDLLSDDFLGQSRISPEGNFEISFYPEDFVSLDSPFETKPDLYFCIYLFGNLLFNSQIWNDVDIDQVAIVVPGKGRVIDLGSVEVTI